MRKETIGPYQLFSMMVLFQLGTAVVVPIGLESGHAVWISILLAMPGGILLYWIYADLYLAFPDLIISGYTQKILGRWIGWPLSLMFLPILLYNGSRNLRECGDFLVSASYDKTPIFVINAIMATAVIYILNKGIEVFARMAEIYFIIIILLGVTCDFVVITAGLTHFKNLFPVHGKEWLEALKSAYPNILIFPFGEVVCFTAVFPQFRKSGKLRNTGIAAIIISACLLSFNHAVIMSVLGTEMYNRTNFPLFTTITLVNVVNFIQRLDALVILILIIDVCFKMSVYCYAAVMITADLFKVQDTRKLVIPVVVVVLFSSFISAENYPVHVKEGSILVKIILPFLCVVIPIVLFLVHRLRRKFGLYR